MIFFLKFTNLTQCLFFNVILINYSVLLRPPQTKKHRCQNSQGTQNQIIKRRVSFRKAGYSLRNVSSNFRYMENIMSLVFGKVKMWFLKRRNASCDFRKENNCSQIRVMRFCQKKRVLPRLKYSALKSTDADQTWLVYTYILSRLFPRNRAEHGFLTKLCLLVDYLKET